MSWSFSLFIFFNCPIYVELLDSSFEFSVSFLDGLNNWLNLPLHPIWTLLTKVTWKSFGLIEKLGKFRRNLNFISSTIWIYLFALFHSIHHKCFKLGGYQRIHYEKLNTKLLADVAGPFTIWYLVCFLESRYVLIYIDFFSGKFEDVAHSQSY